MKCIISTLITAALCLVVTNVDAETITLNNGDRITGQIIEKMTDHIYVRSSLMGLIKINNNHIVSVEESQDEKKVVNKIINQKSKNQSAVAKSEKNKVWKNTLSVGYNQSGGNTENSQADLGVKLHRQGHLSEWNIEASTHYESDDGKMTAQEHYGMIRYGFQLKDNPKWYAFYKMEAERDRFANVDYRLVPSFGPGYWFADTDDLKAMVEFPLGYQYTSYRDDTDSDSELILVPRAFIEAKLFDGLKFQEELTLYPSLEDTDNYRLRSKTSLAYPLSEVLSLKFSLIDDYNSNPKGSAEKNDYRVTTSLEYQF